MTETKGIINFRPLTVETHSNVNSQIPLSPSNLLLQKTNLVYHLLVTLTDQACTHGADEDKFKISLGNFGHVEEMSFFLAFRFAKNGIQKNKTLKLVI